MKQRLRWGQLLDRVLHALAMADPYYASYYMASESSSNYIDEAHAVASQQVTTRASALSRRYWGTETQP